MMRQTPQKKNDVDFQVIFRDYGANDAFAFRCNQLRTISLFVSAEIEL